MARWQEMVLIMALHTWAQQTRQDLDFACGRCQRATTLRQCTYTAPAWAADGTTTGGLACPHCGQETSRAALRAYARLENARSEERRVGKERRSRWSQGA